jgi:phosphoribosylformylglycinamidine synthase PurS subunit
MKGSHKQEKGMEKKEKSGKAIVYVRLKEGVLDPQGTTIKRALEDMGYKGIEKVRSGKFFEITYQSITKKEGLKLVDKISDKLLANPVIEDFKVEILK